MKHKWYTLGMLLGETGEVAVLIYHHLWVPPHKPSLKHFVREPLA